MSLLPLAVAAGFLLAPVAPLVVRHRPRLAGWVLTAVPALLTVYFVTLAPGVLAGTPERAAIEWVPGLGIDLSFSVDSLGLLFALLICGVGTLVVLYSESYLAGHAALGRFQAILLLFMASMLGLVVADNLLLVVVFWGLTGITSFLLIGFDHAQRASRAAASQALLVTAAGELAMLAGVVMLGQVAGTYSLSGLVAAGDTVRDDGLYGAILLLVLAGAFTKSAQVPFHFWLPNAMAAPTPVSAYLHSAAMVKAGVYLLARLSPTLGGTEAWIALVGGAGLATMLIGAFLSLRETDLKRILAYSTVGALGLMTLLLAIPTEAAAAAAMTVLLAHGLYKGALFLVAGSIDHATGTRDVDVLGGLWRRMPFTAAAAGLAALSMAGIPAILGFAAKELGYKAALGAPVFAGLLVVTVAAAGAAFVAVAAVTGLGPFAGRPREAAAGAHEGPPGLWAGPAVLGALGLVAGLVPALGAEALVAGAASVVVGSPVEAQVRPWYGIDAAFGLSVATVLAGVGLFAALRQTRAVLRRVDLGPRVGPERAYELLEAGLKALAAGLTARLQHGRLPLYLLTVVATAVGLAWAVLVALGGLPDLAAPGDIRPHEVVVVAAILCGAVVAVRTDSRLSAVAALGIVGYGLALVYLLFGAPDLAMTQLLVETLTIILFVLVFHHLPRFGTFSSRAARARDAVIAVSGGALMTVLVLAVTAIPHNPISSFFEQAAVPEGRGRNVVNVIIVDFRALDTLGEIAVLALAAFGVFALLKLRPRASGRREDQP
ncbi:MAG TPA: hydrogen gas-evolving membrane-bound hydrogenase subunit E [Desulfobacterales bacterium]|nr:hydrogen gas-evolving membrane-bound hydrogenase subunit E [Desulfobacterales bacterium]